MHLASAADLSGVDVASLVLRLDLVPALLVVAGTTSALATQLSRRAWAGPLAVGLLLVAQDATPLPWGRLVRDPLADLVGVPYDVTFWWSTSGAYAAVVFAPLAVVLVHLVRVRGQEAQGRRALAARGPAARHG